jgi:hypothetical protein
MFQVKSRYTLKFAYYRWPDPVSGEGFAIDRIAILSYTSGLKIRKGITLALVAAGVAGRPGNLLI